MKAICTKRLFEHTHNGLVVVEKGEVVEYTVKERKFIVADTEMYPTTFFNHFKVTEGVDKMEYSDFEYILCNYVFGMAVLFPNEYNGLRHLVIQDMFKGTIMLTVNKEENVIRVSFDGEQKKYSTYEEALDGIRNYKTEE